MSSNGNHDIEKMKWKKNKKEKSNTMARIVKPKAMHILITWKQVLDW
jgi:hypothetical protein